MKLKKKKLEIRQVKRKTLAMTTNLKTILDSRGPMVEINPTLNLSHKEPSLTPTEQVNKAQILKQSRKAMGLKRIQTVKQSLKALRRMTLMNHKELRRTPTINRKELMRTGLIVHLKTQTEKVSKVLILKQSLKIL